MKSIALLGCFFFFAPAWAAELPGSGSDANFVYRPNLGDVLRAAGDLTIPAAWSGVWEFEDTDYDCTTKLPTGTGSDTDTLCTGEAIYGDDAKLNCTGTVSDTEVDVDCTGDVEVFPGCVLTFNFSLTATRSGDTLTSSSTVSQVYTPPLCAFGQPDQCQRTDSVANRVGPEPPDCLTSVEEMSWGRVKAVYR